MNVIPAEGLGIVVGCREWTSGIWESSPELVLCQDEWPEIPVSGSRMYHKHVQPTRETVCDQDLPEPMAIRTVECDVSIDSKYRCGIVQNFMSLLPSINDRELTKTPSKFDPRD